jgi:invasion protein IalB
MRLWSALGVGSLIMTALCMLAFGNGLAQTSQAKGVATPDDAAEAAPSPPTWKVSCSNSDRGLDCRVLQTLFVKRTGQPVLTVAVHVPPDTKKPDMLFSLPLGSYLPAGVSLQFGKSAATKLPILNCDRSGCLAEYAVSPEELGAMQKGSDLTITLLDMQKKPLKFVVPVAGFAEAYAKIR